MISGYAIVKRQTTAALKAAVQSGGKAEYQLHAAVVELLRTAKAPGVVFFHVPNDGKRTPGAAARLKAMGMTAGVPDLCLSLPDRRFAFMEFKAGKGRLSNEQAGFLAAVRDNGHETAVVNSVEQAVAVLSQWGAIRGVSVAA